MLRVKTLPVEELRRCGITENTVTPALRAELDPTGRNAAFVKELKGSHHLVPQAPNRFYTGPDFSEFMHQIRHALTGNDEYWRFNLEQAAKVGPQGGRVPYKELLQGLTRYYEHAHNSVHIDEVLRRGRDYLITLIIERINQKGFPQAANITHYNTFAAIPSGGRKGSFIAETMSMKQFRHMMPAVPGRRYQRLKIRNIFMEATPNVRYIENELATVRNWLRAEFPQYFGAWLNPRIVVNPMLTAAVCAAAETSVVEADYVGMDYHFSWEVVRELILPIYRAALPGLNLAFEAAVEELFHTSIFLDDVIWSGLHNLFSGQVITNDFETLYTVILQLGLAVTYDIPKPRHLALGDDQVFMWKRVKSFTALDVLQEMQRVSGKAGMEIHGQGKSAASEDAKLIRFLRKLYYPKGRKQGGILIGAYPSSHVYNNIVNEEDPSSSPGIDAIACLQRLDGLAGSPDFAAVCRFFDTHLSHRFVFNDADLKNAPVDWWEKVYGERWSPTSSVAYQLLLTMDRASSSR